MQRDADGTLDECLALLQSGQATLDECLAPYPDQAAQLRPLLEMAIEIRRVPPPLSSPAAFEAGKRRMLQALSARESLRPSHSPSSTAAQAAWRPRLM